MFNKILVANRGEIAVRVIRACREMGIATIAVYSEADEHALHSLEADERHCIGKADAAASYLNIDKIIDVAKKTATDAIHPGYGFLAENPDFADACKQNDICFIGPSAEAMSLLGDKLRARRLMQNAGITVIPGMVQGIDSHEQLHDVAGTIGYPIMIKASAGGGGKGMRIVHSKAELDDALESGKREAKAAFGCDSIYIEKYIENPRHIEFQVLADHHGNTIHLFERECSIQRRHQKIIEESPSQQLTDALRAKMAAVAIEVVKNACYTNAGTVEFLLDRDDNFYFLEVNTRLQVEHTITEMVTGIDLVKQQIKIASGEKLDISQQDVMQKGHAIECRIYAEDPKNDFVPSFGKIVFLKEPAGPWIRVDSGIRNGMNIPIEYDPILSKLIAWGINRDEACARMQEALKQYIVLGVETQIPYLIDLLSHEEFKKGDVDTNFIRKNMNNWSARMENEDIAGVVAALQFLHQTEHNNHKPVVRSSPWTMIGKWNI